jgi:N-acetylglutamate synthase-like GNAT family acetyltransferase
VTPAELGETMAGGLMVRRAGPADAQRLADFLHLVHSNSPDPFHSMNVSRFLADPRNFQIVAEEESRLVSSMTMTYCAWNDSYELGYGPTHPHCRSHGLGAQLVQRVVDWVCDAGLGEMFISSPRAKRLVDLFAALKPPMIVAGHGAGRAVANHSRETDFITLSIPEHARFVHVTPPVAESASGAFVRERIYRPLGLTLAPGEYPPESLAGATSEWSLEWGDLVVDYNPNSPNHALAIVGGRARPDLLTPCRRDVDRLFQALPRVEHIIVTVLADKMDSLRELSSFGFEFAAYLPAWFKGGAFRYDCIQLVLRRRRAQRAARDCRGLLSRFQREIVSDRRSAAAYRHPVRHVGRI